MKSYFYPFNLLLAFGVLIACQGNRTAGHDQARNTSGLDTVSIIDDPAFSNGIRLAGGSTSNVTDNTYLFPFGGEAANVRWRLAEWGSRILLEEDIKRIEAGEVIYENRGKVLSFSCKDNAVAIRMDVVAEHEYDHVRVEGEYWPHLLLEQTFSHPPSLLEMKGLLFSIRTKLHSGELRMPESEFNPGLHSAQFQLFVTLQDTNPESAGNGDFLWFGLPLYDYRYREVPEYRAEDIGKEDASAKFIYMLPSTTVFGQSMHDRQWVSAQLDIYPELIKGFADAQLKGFLKGCALEDMKVTSLNIGWENTGTINSGVVFEEFDLRKIIAK